jgi:hypothetical protein
MNTKNALTLKGLAALLLGVTVVASSCKKDGSDLMTPNEISDSTLSGSVKPEGIMGTLTPTSTSALIFESLLEKSQTGFNSSEGGDWNGVEAANENSITRSTEQAKKGSYSAKFNLNKTDSYVSGSLRAELTDWNGRMTDPKSERWYGISMFLPTSYIADACEEIVFQWHGVNSIDLDGKSMNNPPIAMLTRNGIWELMIMGTKINLGSYTTNAWTDWVLHIKFSPDGSNGIVEVWKNGKLVLTRTGKNTHNDSVGNYFKMGIYKYGWKDGYPTNTTSRTAYYDEVRTGNANSSYAEVAPRSNTTTTETTVTTTEQTQNPVVFAINSGGASFQASNGITYEADKNFSGGRISQTTSAIANTSDDVLYQSERYGTFGYAIPVTNGTYEITFKFAEIYQKSSGARKFDIFAEGTEVIKNLDIFAIVGRNTKYDVVRTINVSDGVLNIQTRTDVNNAKISAFHIIKK